MNERTFCEFKPLEKENYLAIVSPNGKDAMHKFTNLLHKEKLILFLTQSRLTNVFKRRIGRSHIQIKLFISK